MANEAEEKIEKVPHTMTQNIKNFWKKIVPALPLLTLLLFVVFAQTFFQQQTKTKSGAQASTTIALTPETSNAAVGQNITAAVNVNPGANMISFIKFTINYDPTKLAASSSGIQILPWKTINGALFNPTVVEGPTYGMGSISATVSVGSSPQNAIQAPTQIATVTFMALAPTENSPTAVSLDIAKTQVFSIASTDQVNENVLSTVSPANITISGAIPTITPGSACGPCPMYSLPAPDFCKNGVIVSQGVDNCKCPLPPICKELTPTPAPIKCSIRAGQPLVACPPGYTCVNTCNPAPGASGCAQYDFCRPNGTPVPTQTCKVGLNTFSPSVSCGQGLYRYADYECYDQSKGQFGGPTTCKTAEAWKAELEVSACAGLSSCSPTSDPCNNWKSAAFFSICPTTSSLNKFAEATYECKDGTSGKIAGNGCLTADDWTKQAKAVCGAKCAVSPTPTITPQPKYCTDSDGGKNYDTKGSNKNYLGDYFTDYCINSTQLYEGSCNTDSTILRTPYTCPNGCLNGACIGGITPTLTPPGCHYEQVPCLAIACIQGKPCPTCSPSRLVCPSITPTPVIPTKIGCNLSPAYNGDLCAPNGYRLVTSLDASPACYSIDQCLKVQAISSDGTCVKSPTYPGDACVGYRFMPGVSRSCYTLEQCLVVTKSTPTATACTLDVRQCSNGSYVSRIPPNCEFKPCPLTPTPSQIKFPNCSVRVGQPLVACPTGYTCVNTCNPAPGAAGCAQYDVCRPSADVTPAPTQTPPTVPSVKDLKSRVSGSNVTLSMVPYNSLNKVMFIMFFVEKAGEKDAKNIKSSVWISVRSGSNSSYAFSNLASGEYKWTVRTVLDGVDIDGVSFPPYPGTSKVFAQSKNFNINPWWYFWYR